MSSFLCVLEKSTHNGLRVTSFIVFVMSVTNLLLYLEDVHEVWNYTNIAVRNISQVQEWQIPFKNWIKKISPIENGGNLDIELPWKYSYSTPSFDRKKSSPDRERLIVFWTSLYRSPSFFSGRSRFHDCPHKCVVSNNRSLVADSDAVIFHMWDLMGSTYFPRNRKPYQKYILYGREPPLNVDLTDEYNYLFNVTHTFKEDADVFFSYGRFINRTSPLLDTYNDYLKSKTRDVAWIVSHCNASSLRDSYVNELQKYIRVDIYGKCGSLHCGSKDKAGETNCTHTLREHYKFYLAFENSLCDDYVTEKVWKALRHDVIPVVLGNAYYKKLLPLNSYIDVRNFSSPESLAAFLKHVGSTQSVYNSYFEWKATYELETVWNHFCDLCTYLHTHENITQIYTDLSSWWNQCVTPKQYYKGVADNIYEALTD